MPVIIGKSTFIQSLLKVIEKVARSGPSNVLIEGESGTGKELVAKAIHWQGPRSDHPFVAINCAALPAPLLETELMGYAAGAFTDAKTNKKGLLEFADKGTIFFDEISSMGLGMQTKILRLLEEKSFRPLGSNKEVKIDVHFISATNILLKKRMEEGRFRDDLYYRLTTIPIYIQPLREHKDDILVLAEHFLAEFKTKFNKKAQTLSTPVIDFFLSYHWPGNVRQLKNVIEGAMLINDSETILYEHLPADILSERGERKNLFLLPKQGISLTEVEKDLIGQALKMAYGNQSEAAKLLGLHRDAFRRRMKKYNLFPGEG